MMARSLSRVCVCDFSSCRRMNVFCGGHRSITVKRIELQRPIVPDLTKGNWLSTVFSCGPD